MKLKIAVDSDLVKAFDRLMREMPWLGYRDFDGFVLDAVRDKILKLRFAEKNRKKRGWVV